MLFRSTYSKKGFGVQSLLKVSYGFGAFSDYLKPFASGISISHKKGRAVYVDAEKDADVSSSWSRSINFTISGLPYRIPLSLDIEHSMPFAGRNEPLAIESLTILA